MKQSAFLELASLAVLLGVLACVQGALLTITDARQTEATQARALRTSAEITPGATGWIFW
jgi:hypothetical protein